MYVLIITTDWNVDDGYHAWRLLATFTQREAAESARKVLWNEMGSMSHVLYNGVIIDESDNLEIWYVPEWTESFLWQERKTPFE